MDDVERLGQQIDRLADKIGQVALGQAALLQQMKDSEKRRAEEKHEGRISMLERNQFKVICGSALLGTLAGWAAEFIHGGGGGHK
jgi:hypothetical protein